MFYDVMIVGAGPGGIFSAYELMKLNPSLKVAPCSIMNGFGGAGAFSDGKYNITNNFGGTLYEYIGKDEALSLMRYVDEINLNMGGLGTKLYSTSNSKIKTLCVQNNLHLLDASVRHLGTDINYVVLQNLYDTLKDKVDFHFLATVEKVEKQIPATVFTPTRKHLRESSASFPAEEAEANGWRMSAKTLKFPPIPIGWTSAYGSSCLTRFLPI